MNRTADRQRVVARVGSGERVDISTQANSRRFRLTFARSLLAVQILLPVVDRVAVIANLIR